MILKNYKNFIVQENINNDLSKLIYSDSFRQILNDIDDNISHYLLSLENKESDITHIDTTDKNNYVSFLQSRAYNKINLENKNPWDNNSRQELRIGKLLTRLLEDNKFDKKDVENFINDYKAQSEFGKYLNRFEIVKGKDITKYYLCDNQVYKGPLSKSCMGTRDQKRFIESFFETNPEKINMLILRDKGNPELIVGRANLWRLDNPDGRIFMDRVYTTEDYLINIFIGYAKIKNYIYKKRQIYGGHVVPVIDNGIEKKLKMSTFLKNIDYKYYPYVDTLQFYNKKTGEITNDTSKWDITDTDEWIALIHAGGHYLTKDNDSGFKMDYMGRLIHPYYVVWSNVDKCYIHVNDAVRLSYKNDFCVPERDVVEKDGKFYLKEDV